MKQPRLRFPEFMGDWKQHKFEDVVTIGSGKDYKHLESGNVPVYGTGGYMLSVNQALSESEDAIGIGRKGTIDKPYILRAPFWTVDTLFYCIPNEGLDLTFTNCLFQNVDWKKKDESTGVPSLSKVIINNVKTYVPSLEEQQKIASLFTELDSLIQSAEKELEGYRELKQGMLQKMFPKKGEKVPEIRFPEFTGDWEQRKLGELGSLKNGMNFSKEAMGIGFPFINLQNIFGNNVIDVTNLGKAMASDSQLKDYNLLNGDVLFVRSSVKLEGVGEAALVPQNLENTTYSGFIIRFRDEYGLDNNFKRFIFGIESVRNQIMAQATNSANKNISQTVLENLCLKIPNKSEQEKIGLYFSNLDNLITLHQRELDGYKELKNGLLQQMFC